ALDVRLRAEDTVRVLVDERLIFGVLYTNVVRDSPVVEDRPAEGRATEGFEAPPLEELVRILRLEIDRADERQVREQIRLGDPDLRALGRSISRRRIDRKSTRLNSSHVAISYAGFCLKKKIESARAKRSRIC